MLARLLPLGAATLALLLSAACSDTYDTLVPDNPIDPSALDDTAPPEAPYDASLDFVGRSGFVENHSTDRYRFDVAALNDAADAADSTRLFASHAAHLAAHPTAIPSVQTVGTHLKQIDDTIYAGVERAVQDGLEPTVAPKRALLEGALGWLVAHRSTAADQAIVVTGAALELGGASTAVPPDLADDVIALREQFLASPLESKPIGFYTWSDPLKQIWQQDRLLQRALPSGEATCALAEAIAADPDRTARYHELVALYSRLTNPVVSSLEDVLPVAGDPSCASLGPRSFLSVSRTAEGHLFSALYPNGVPDGADLMQDLIDAIRSGAVDLTPGPDDGWYGHQLYALETLLVTDRSEERRKIAFMARYKRRLQEAFQTMVTQHRETHAKQTGAMLASAPATPPVPSFRVEPLATVYVRHARSYVFLEGALDAVLGPSLLDEGVAVAESGPTTDTLRARIHRARDLFYGLYLISCQDLGMHPALEGAGDPAADAWPALIEAADAWLLALAGDPVAAADVRVMIPIADLGGGRARYWAVVGVRTTLAGYSFIDGMDVSPPAPERQARVPLPTEQFVEVTSSAEPLTRDELRALCDHEGTVEKIVAALEAR